MSTPRLRIAHIAGTPVGAPWLVSMIREQRRRGHEVSAILCPPIEGVPETLPTLFEAEGVPCYRTRLDLAAGTPLVATAFTILRLARLLRRLRIDVVQHHLFPSIVTGRLASWAIDTPLRFSMIPGTLYLEAPILGYIEAGTAWADTKVIATCHRTRELYGEHEVPLEHVEVIYYGLDTSKFDPARADGGRVRRELGLRQDQPVIGMVAYFYGPLRNAHLCPPHLVGKGLKGHETVLAAIPRIASEFPDAKIVFVGTGWYSYGMEYYAQVQQLARDLGVADRVIFTGERDDIPDVLASFDVALQCSLSENLGGSIEALTMQRPLIVTRVGGLVDSVKHEKTGLLIEPENPEQLADAVIRLLRDRALAARLATQGRAFMLDEFTVQKTVDDLDALFVRELQAEGIDGSRAPHEQRYRPLVIWTRFLQLPVRVARVVACVERMRVRVKGLSLWQQLRSRIARVTPARLKRVLRQILRPAGENA